jgi:hypothetical protein
MDLEDDDGMKIRAMCHHRMILSPPELDMLQGNSSLGLVSSLQQNLHESVGSCVHGDEAALKTSVKCRPTSHFTSPTIRCA